MNQKNIENALVTQLQPWSRNARTHSKKQIQQIADSIETFGFTNPVLIDEDMNILAGHGRVLAAQSLKLTEVPCIRIEHMSPAQKKAYVIADNKLALNAGWDEDMLAIELGELLELELSFDINLTGFSDIEIDNIIDCTTPEDNGNPEDDRLPKDEDSLRTCLLGDIWQLGPHRLICGDALKPETTEMLMNGDLATSVITDPPYNVRIDGNVCGSGSIKHPEFTMASGEMSSDTFTDFLKTSFKNLKAHSIEGSIHFIFMDWRHISEILLAGQSVYTELKNMIVWVKDNGGMGTFYRSRHELIFVFKNGTAPHINNFELGQHGRYRTNVWEYRGMNSRSASRQDELALHPTVKPVQMIADAIRDVSGRGDIILDIFGGSGSTLIAAHKTGRRAYLAEIDPIYCARTIRRWEQYAHDEAILVSRNNDCESSTLLDDTDIAEPPSTEDILLEARS